VRDLRCAFGRLGDYGALLLDGTWRCGLRLDVTISRLTRQFVEVRFKSLLPVLLLGDVKPESPALDESGVGFSLFALDPIKAARFQRHLLSPLRSFDSTKEIGLELLSASDDFSLAAAAGSAQRPLLT
jgi:hypothetical protein